MVRVRRGLLTGILTASLILLGLLLLLAGPLLPARAWSGLVARQSTPSVSIDPSSAEVDVGDTVEIDVRVADVTDLAYADVLVLFDPELLQVVDADPDTSGVQVTAGSFMGADASEEENDVDQAVGEVYFSQGVLSDTVSGSGVLATIVFSGTAAGTSDVVIDADYVYLEDGAEDFIAVDAEDGSITVSAAGDVTPSASASPLASPSPSPSVSPSPSPSAAAQPTSSPTVQLTSPPTGTPLPTRTPFPTPRPTLGYESRTVQMWPDRSVGVSSVLLQGASSYADAQVFPFGVLGSPAEGVVEARTYLQFPIDRLPLGTDVKRALLYVYVDSGLGMGEETFGAYRVLEPWDDASWGGTPATWPALISSPVAVTRAGPDETEAVAVPSAAKRARLTWRQSPLSTPPQSPLSTQTPTPTASPVATAAPGSTQTPTSTATRTPTPSPTVVSSPPVATLVPDPLSTALPVSSLELDGIAERWIVWDVTALIRAWVADEVDDHGLAVALVPDPDAGPGPVGDLLLARLLTAGDPDTDPYIVADIDVYPVTPTPTPTPIPLLPVAGGSDAGGWGGVVVSFAGLVLLVLGLALAFGKRLFSID